MNAYTLYDAVCASLERTRWRWTRPLRRHRYAIRLTAPTVEIRDADGAVVQSWAAEWSDATGHAFTRRQAKQIRKALVQVMRTEAARMEVDVLAKLNTWRPY